LRILNYPKRGIGGTSADRLIRLSAESQTSLWQLMQQAAEIEGLPTKALGAIADFVELLNRYRKRFNQPQSMVETLSQLVSELKLEAELYRQETDPQKARRRIENQAEVVNAMGAYLEREPEPSLAGFLERVSLLDNDQIGRHDKEKKLAQNAVTLMSLHSSKGLEFPVVFLVGMEEESLPHKKSIYETFDIDEERRLCYVGMTRARVQLVLLGARKRRRYGSLSQRDPSRFLAEIPADTLLRLSSEVPRETSEAEKEQLANSFFAGISNLLGGK